MAGLKAIFAKALEELEDMSGAKVGDKTMMDALIPASEAVAAYTGDSADELFDAAAQAAAQGRRLRSSMSPNSAGPRVTGPRPSAPRTRAPCPCPGSSRGWPGNNLLFHPQERDWQCTT